MRRNVTSTCSATLHRHAVQRYIDMQCNVTSTADVTLHRTPMVFMAKIDSAYAYYASTYANKEVSRYDSNANLPDEDEE